MFTVTEARCCGLMSEAESMRKTIAWCSSACSLHLHTLWIGSKMCVMSCVCLMNMHKAMPCLHFDSIWASIVLLFFHLFPPYLGQVLHLWPLLNKPQPIYPRVLKETRKWRRGKKVETAEERDKTTQGQRGKEMSSVCAWLDLLSCILLFFKHYC